MWSFLSLAALGLVLVNLWTIARFWQDKQRAISGGRRISESDLLSLAILGGTPGALLARRWFRHKTLKEPFSTQLLVIAMVQAGLILGLAVAFVL